MLTGENGVLTKATDAKREWELAEEDEENKLTNMEEIMNSILGEETTVKDSNPGELAGSGTEEDPFLIESIEDLVAFSNNVNAGEKYEGKVISLHQTLNFSSDNSYVDPNRTDFGDINGNNKIETLKIELTSGRGFNPIGKVESIQGGSDDFGIEPSLIGKSFKGIFNGNEKAIKELYINVETDKYSEGIGLFGWNEGTIKNLITTGTINDKVGVRCGGISGFSNGNIENCINNIDVTSTYAGAGIAGGVLGSVTIKNAVNNGKIVSEHMAGGIIGATDNEEMKSQEIVIIQNSINKNEIIGASVGGILGQAKDTNVNIEECYNEGKITAMHYGGGIAGEVSNGTYEDLEAKISKSYNNGEVVNQNTNLDEEYTENIGGIVGYLYAWGSSNYAQVDNCYNKGKLTNIYTTGGIVGKCDAYSGNIKILNSYNLGEAYGKIYSAGIVGQASTSNREAQINVDTSYNAGKVLGEEHIGGIVGYVDLSGQYFVKDTGRVNIENCYNIGEIEYNNGSKKFVGGICAEIYNSEGRVSVENCCNIGNININGENVGGVIGKINDADNYINKNYYNNYGLGAINGEDIEQSAEYNEDMPYILEIIGESFKEDMNSEFPILNWQ